MQQEALELFEGLPNLSFCLPTIFLPPWKQDPALPLCTFSSCFPKCHCSWCCPPPHLQPAKPERTHLFSAYLKSQMHLCFSIVGEVLSYGNRLLLSLSSWQPPCAYAEVAAHPEGGKPKATIHCWCMPKTFVGVRYVFLVILVLTRSYCKSTFPFLCSLLISCRQPYEVCDVGTSGQRDVCVLRTDSSHKAHSGVGIGFCSSWRVICKWCIE